jgi:hypothetical protein
MTSLHNFLVNSIFRSSSVEKCQGEEGQFLALLVVVMKSPLLRPLLSGPCDSLDTAEIVPILYEQVE